MGVISRRFADELSEKKMRDAYLSAQTRTKLANQIRAIRNQRGWLQGEFAKILRKPQSNVSRLENREYGNFTFTTLLELASAFDVGLVVEFVPYDDFLRRTQDLRASHLRVRPFSAAALEPLYRDAVQTAVTTAISAMPTPVENLAYSASTGGANRLLGYVSQGTVNLDTALASGSARTYGINPATALADTTVVPAGIPAQAFSANFQTIPNV